jgi:hypothetical protein
LAENWPDDLLHFQLMKAAVFEYRETVRRALRQWTRPTATPTFAQRQRGAIKIATEAIAKLDASSKRAKARESYDAVMAKWVNMVASILKPAKDHNEAVMHAQIRDRLFNLKDERERMRWLERNVGDPVAASALLTAPAFVSDLSDTEWRWCGARSRLSLSLPKSSKRRPPRRRPGDRSRQVGG